jgi:hypothetical protein
MDLAADTDRAVDSALTAPWQNNPMAISGDYSSPVRVNGFACRNCADVDRAKRHIDPANPASGPFGINETARAGRADQPRAHFAADARSPGHMQAVHAARRSAPSSPVAAAYAQQAAPGAGQFVDRTA